LGASHTWCFGGSKVQDSGGSGVLSGCVHSPAFQTAARVEMPDGAIAKFPVKFDLLPSGDAATGALLVQESLHTDLGSGIYA
jgi:hypothetical protein